MGSLFLFCLSIALAVFATYTNSSTTTEDSQKLNITLRGSVLTWHHQLNQSSDITGYYIMIYSMEQGPSAVHSQWTNESLYDLRSIKLPNGDYYIQVVGVTNGSAPYSDTIVYTVKGSDLKSDSNSNILIVIVISCTLALGIMLGSIFFALTIWNLSRKKWALQSGRAESSGSERDQTWSETESAAASVKSSSAVALYEDPAYEPLPLQPPIRFPSVMKNTSVDYAVPNDAILSQSRPTYSSADSLPYGYISPGEINTPPQSKSNTYAELDHFTMPLAQHVHSTHSSVSDCSGQQYLKLLK